MRFSVCIGGGWCGIVKLLRSLVVVARGVSRANFTFLVHVCLKFVVQVGQVLCRESVGSVHANILCGRGPWHLGVQCLWCQRGLRCERKRQPPHFL